MEHLDRYEANGMDDAFIDDVTEEERFAARLAAERELAERDAIEGRLTGRRRGLPAALEGAWDAAQHRAQRWAGSLQRGTRMLVSHCAAAVACSWFRCRCTVRLAAWLRCAQRSWTTMSGGHGAGGGWRRRRRAWTMTRSWCAAEEPCVVH